MSKLISLSKIIPKNIAPPNSKIKFLNENKIGIITGMDKRPENVDELVRALPEVRTLTAFYHHIPIQASKETQTVPLWLTF